MMPISAPAIDYSRIGSEVAKRIDIDYIAQQNFLYHPDKSALFTLRAQNPFVSPVTISRKYGDPGEAIIVDPTYPYLYRLKYIDGLVALYSKRAFRYGVFGFNVQLPPTDDPIFDSLWLGAEPTGGGNGGYAFFYFKLTGGTLRTYIGARSIDGSGGMWVDVTSLMPVNPTAGRYDYVVKVNRASVEFWVSGRLIGIIQFANGAISYTVRSGPPYYLGQAGGNAPCVMPVLIESSCASASCIGAISSIIIGNIWVSDGDPAPPRSLSLYTGGTSWDGYSISSGTLTSDGVPVAGYEKKEILLLANGSGTLYIDVDYGTNAFDQYDSISVSANTLVRYVLTDPVLWVRLRFTPNSYPTTVTRAKVVMS